MIYQSNCIALENVFILHMCARYVCSFNRQTTELRFVYLIFFKIYYSCAINKNNQPCTYYNSLYNEQLINRFKKCRSHQKLFRFHLSYYY